MSNCFENLAKSVPKFKKKGYSKPLDIPLLSLPSNHLSENEEGYMKLLKNDQGK